jgi:type VI secretion system protein VasG
LPWQLSKKQDFWMSHIDLNRLIRTLAPSLRIGLEAAASLAARHQHATVDISHWLRSLLDLDDAAAVFEKLGLPIPALRQELDAAIEDVRRDGSASLSLSQNLLTLAREAWIVASLQYGRQSVALADLLVALTSEQSLRIVVRAIVPSLREIDAKALDSLLKAAEAPSGEAASAPAIGGVEGDNEFLRLYTHDMTADARSGRIDPVIGRDGELRQVIDILMRRRQNNPILVGEAGVGKTAVAEALALEIAAGNVPERLRDIRLLLLDLSLLQAGAGVKGEFERRLHGVIDAVKKSPQPVILFIDEAHGLIGAGGQAGQGDAANILKPALARGELRTIAATTWSEYKRHIEKDTALTRRFQVVQVHEPDEETAIRMLRGVAKIFSAHHEVRIRDEALAAAVRLSARYLPSRQLPDKAISLIDTASAAVSLARQTTPDALKTLRNERDLLESEALWLKNEPRTAEIAERLLRIEAERRPLDEEITALEGRLSEELRLLSEVDRLEAAFSGEAMPAANAAEGEAAGANVAQLPVTEQSAENARKAFAAAEAKLAALTGEKPLVPRIVDRDVVAGVVSRWTGIPVGKLLSDQVETVKTLEAKLKERVIGQDLAIERIASTMRAARAGLSDPRKPPAVFLLVGMSGTGKTETALTLADILYGGPQHLTTLNMSEFKEEHKVSTLLGSPPGYVGYGEGGVLTEAVRRRPYGVLLLDEIDKAHPGVQEIFYQVFDKGTLRDGEGRDIDFKNTTIFMTANTGSELLAALSADPDTMPEGEALEALLLPELKKQFKPAFLGRTIILPFMPLGRETLSGIVDIQIGRICDRLAATYGTAAALAPEAREALISRAKSSEMGARAIEVMISRDLLPVLSTFFLDMIADRRKAAHIDIGFDGRSFTVAAQDAPQTDQTEFASSTQGRANAAAPHVDRPIAATTRKATAP